jgi:ArsR family metal-binding transcriptional regulator
MLIEGYSLELGVSTHSAEHFSHEAIAHLASDIRAVLPYLNATLPGAIYVPGKPALSWRYEDHKVAFWPDRIALDDSHSREEAVELIGRLVALVNDTWEKRGEIVPDTTVHERRQPLELYRLLPRTDCGACGESGCFQFALKLATGLVALEQCAPLVGEAGRAGQREKLASLLARKWPAV